MAGSMKASMKPRVHARGWALVVLLAATGCTICPDPFDYSGPVPNGSAPQNDFRARSGGIAPVGGVPRPWPPVVQAAPDAGTDEKIASAAIGQTETEEAVVAGDAPVDATGVQPVAAEEVPPAAAEATAEDVPQAVTEPAVAAEPVVEPASVNILPPARPARAEIVPALRETPGWRPRD